MSPTMRTVRRAAVRSFPRAPVRTGDPGERVRDRRSRWRAHARAPTDAAMDGPCDPGRRARRAAGSPSKRPGGVGNSFGGTFGGSAAGGAVALGFTAPSSANYFSSGSAQFKEYAAAACFARISALVAAAASAAGPVVAVRPG